MYIVKNLFKKSSYVDIARLEGKVLVIKVWSSNGAKRKKIFHYDIFEDNAIDGQRLFGVKLSIDEKVIAKPEQLKRKQKKKHPNVLILHFKKMDRK
jgi:ribonuclease-3